MFIGKKVKNVFSLVLVSLIAQGSLAFAGEDVNVSEKSVDLKEVRAKEERGLDMAKRAVRLSDPYPVMKTEAGMKDKELDSLVEREKYLTATIQRLKIGLMRKRAKYARSPELLKISVKQYSQKIIKMEDELTVIEKQMPVLESKLASVTIEVEAEELKRGIMMNEEDAEGFDEEFDEAILERWKTGKMLLNQGF